MALHPALRRIGLACSCLGLLLGLSLTGAPAAPAESSLPAPVGEQGVLSTCLLPAPPGYVVSPQQKERQKTPFPLTPAQRAWLFSPYFPGSMGQTMGWTVSDREYTASIPAEAKVVPRDLSSLPALRFNNLEIHGERELRFRSHGEYDQWFLRDETRKLNALLAIHRETRRVYFFEYRWRGDRLVFDQSTETCYSCHVSGPRVVRTYNLEKVDPVRLAEFNRKLLSYGAADFGDSIDPVRLGPALEDERCTGCHEDRTRGRLYAMHLPTVAYYLQTLRAMPPGAPLASEESGKLITGQFQRYQGALAGQIRSAGAAAPGASRAR